MKILAYGWSVTHSQVYLDTLSYHLNAWLEIYQVTYNPIEEEKVTNMIVAYDLVKDHLSGDLNLKIKGFLEELLAGYLRGIKERSEKTLSTCKVRD